MVDLAKLKFPIICVILQVLFIIIYAIGGKYGPGGGKYDFDSNKTALEKYPQTYHTYPCKYFVSFYSGLL